MKLEGFKLPVVTSKVHLTPPRDGWQELGAAKYVLGLILGLILPTHPLD